LGIYGFLLGGGQESQTKVRNTIMRILGQLMNNSAGYTINALYDKQSSSFIKAMGGTQRGIE
jgi:hypothetical protein